MNPLRLVRALVADLLLAAATLADHIDTHYADAINGEDDE